jgi:hypothetical protein
VSAPGHRGALHVTDDVFERFGGADAVIVCAGCRLAGVVTDPRGRPVAARSCGSSGRREARAVTDDHGRFTLWGVTPGGEVTAFHPLTGAWQRVEGVTPGRDLVVRLAAVRPELPVPDAVVRVRARDAAGAAVADVRVALVGEDGRWYDAWTEDEPTGEGAARVVVGEARLPVPAGRYEVRPSEVFAATTFARTEVVAVAGRDVAVGSSSRRRRRSRWTRVARRTCG